MKHYEPEHGAILQLAMAEGYQKHGDFIMEFGDIFNETDFSPQPSNHFPPLYPFLISNLIPHLDMNYSAGSYDCFMRFKFFSFCLSVFTLILIFFLTNALFGLTQGLFTAALVSIGGMFIDNSAKCLGENLQIILLTLFIFTFFRSVRRKWFLILSGLFLGLSYLSKSTLPFWGTIAVTGFLFIFVIINERHFLFYAIISYMIFILTIFPWGLRNYILFRSFETSGNISSSIIGAFLSPLLFLKGLVLNFIPIAIIPMIIAMIFSREVRKISVKSPNDIVLIIFSFGAYVISLFYSSSFYAREGYYLPYNTIRYTIVGFIPLIWVILRNLDSSVRTWVIRLIICVVIFLLSGISLYVWAINTSDKPLINEADIAMSRFIRNSEDINSICFSKLINKNDWYYYKISDDIYFGYGVQDSCKYILITNITEAPEGFVRLFSVDSSGNQCSAYSESAKRILMARKGEPQSQ